MGSFLAKFKDPKYLLKIAIVAAVYYISAKFGLSLAYSIKQVTLVWPPTGISLAVLLLFGLDFWPGILIGAFLANITSMETVRAAVGIASGNTLEALVGASLLQFVKFNKSFSRVMDALLFVLIAAVFGSAISATIGTISLIYGGIGNWKDFWTVWLNWWTGDALGAIVFTPAILVWSRVTKYKFNLFSGVEGIILLIILVFLNLLLFTGTFPYFSFEYQVQFKYLMFPFLLWASYRFKQKGSTLGVLIVGAIGVWGAITGSGPFLGSGNPEKGLLFLDSFIGAISLTFLIFSSLVQEKESAEEKIIDSEKRFRSLIENSSDAILLVDPVGTITYASQSIKRVTGYDPSELVGTNGFNIIYSDDIDNSRKTLKSIMENPGKTISMQNRLVRKDGQVRWMEAEGMNLLNDPAVGAIIVNFRDINDRMQLDQVKTEFVSLSAHQLRSPLSTIRWYTESLMKEKTFPKNLMSYLSEVYSAVLKMAETVNLLLDVSRFELGSVNITSEPVKLNVLVDDILIEKKTQIESKDLIITKNYKEIPEILGDTKLIKVIVENLVGNAIKYTPTGGKITVSLTPQKDNILFAISDSGIGIPIADRDKIFTKLFRGSNVKSVEPGGLGLGLYLIRLIVDLKGGDIWFESEEGKGTTFFVEFPKKVRIIKNER